MLPVFNHSGQSGEKQLKQLFRQLDRQDQYTLLQFARFLAANSQKAVGQPLAVFPAPVAIERPAQESVVKAIKRLTATYPMLERDTLLHRTSDLMAAHVVNGKPAIEVVDELEAFFAEKYNSMKNEFEKNQRTTDESNQE